jgi:4-hydroxy 2-oxovalerate aldolase
MSLNENYGKNYCINHILELIDAYVLKLFKEFGWGYSLQFYLAALNDCHPKYVNYLTGKRTLEIQSVNDILGKIAPEHKLTFNEPHIEALYKEYQDYNIYDAPHIAKLHELLGGKQVVLVGPGKSLLKNSKQVKEFAKTNSCTIIAVNFAPKDIKPDFLFVSNKKRYNELLENDAKIDNTKLIATSNVAANNEDFGFVLNLEPLLNSNPITMDNSMLMLVKALINLQVKTVYLAGFDGFSGKTEQDYADKALNYSFDEDSVNKRNEAISSLLFEYSKQIGIEFLTPSLYKIEK